jgi:NitT/TauT family transport system permease protein
MWKKSLSAVALVAMWLLVWETAFRLSGKRDWEFPPPLQVVQAFWTGMTDGSFLYSLGASLGRVAYGFVLALGIGCTLGLLLSTSRFFQWLLGPLVLGIQSLPSICWLPVSILWFGLNEAAILFIVLMGSVGSITIATRDGLSQIPMTYRRVAGTFGASFWQRLFWVNVPAALPVFISGLKQGWSFAWRSLLAGELIRDVVGVGGLLTKARDLGEYARMFASMILILLVSVLVDKVVFSNLERRVRARWGS